MLDAAVLAQALRAGIRLRDKVVVLAVDGAEAADPAKIDAIAADLALARALGIKVVTVIDPGKGSGPLDAQRPALGLAAALDRCGERGVSLPATGIVTVHRIPPEALAAAPGMPAMIPVVNTMVLIHLSTLGYVPIVLPPIADAAGEAVELGAAAIAVFIAQFMSAALLVLPEAAPLVGPADPPIPPIVVSGSASPGSLITSILLHAPEVPDVSTPAAAA